MNAVAFLTLLAIAVFIAGAAYGVFHDTITRARNGEWTWIVSGIFAVILACVSGFAFFNSAILFMEIVL